MFINKNSFSLTLSNGANITFSCFDVPNMTDGKVKYKTVVMIEGAYYGVTVELPYRNEEPQLTSMYKTVNFAAWAIELLKANTMTFSEYCKWIEVAESESLSNTFEKEAEKVQTVLLMLKGLNLDILTASITGMFYSKVVMEEQEQLKAAKEADEAAKEEAAKLAEIEELQGEEKFTFQIITNWKNDGKINVPVTTKDMSFSEAMNLMQWHYDCFINQGFNLVKRSHKLVIFFDELLNREINMTIV